MNPGGLLLLVALAAQDPDPGQPSLTREALAWSARHPALVWDVSSDGGALSRVELTAGEVRQGERRYLELVLTRRTPPDAEFAEREVVWLGLDDQLTPAVVRLFEATQLASQRAKLGVTHDGKARRPTGKLTGTVDGRGLVRNVPTPVLTEAGVLLRAALMPRKQGSPLAFTWLGFDRRGAVIQHGESLVFTGYQTLAGTRLACFEQRSATGRLRSVLRLDDRGILVTRAQGKTAAVTWTVRPPAEDDER
jgi:hypothetical protein